MGLALADAEDAALDGRVLGVAERADEDRALVERELRRRGQTLREGVTVAPLAAVGGGGAWAPAAAGTARAAATAATAACLMLI